MRGRRSSAPATLFAAGGKRQSGAPSELGPVSRQRRAIQKGDSTRIVAVGGQWIELQCPLASELLAVASSQPENRIVWRKDGQQLSQLNPRLRVGAQNGSLTILSGQQKLDEGIYECSLVESESARVLKAHKFELQLILAPRLAPFEFPSDAQVGMKLVLTCSILEGQQPMSFVWLKDNQIIETAERQQQQQHRLGRQPSSLNQLHQQQLADKLALGFNLASGKSLSEYVLLAEQQGAHSASKAAGEEDGQQLLPLLSDSNIRVRQSDDYSILSIDKLELKHSGRYTCSVQNEAARASHSSKLLINAPPALTVEPRDGDLVSGQSVQIDCAASGQPRPSVSWLRARESANSAWDYVPVYDNLRYTILPNGSLAIANVTQREQGYYMCSAKNGFGPEVTKLIKITVHEPAKFGAKFKTVEVRVEERANIVCVATGEQPVSLEWLDKDGNLIQKGDKRFMIESDPSDTGLGGQAENVTVSRLILARSGRAHSGHYTCKAANKYGSDKMIFNLLVQDVPDRVTDLKVTNTTASTIFLRWQLGFSGNAPITSYLVQYQSDDPLDDLLLSSEASLRPQTSSSQSNPASEPDFFRVATQTSNSVPNSSLSLKAALDALNVAPNLESADEAIDRTLVELTVEQSSTHLVVKDLNPFCVYRLRLAGINKIGLGEFSEWIRARTEEAPPSGTVLRVSASATGPNSIKVSWSPPDRRSWNGQLIGFNIGYRPVDSNFELNKTVEWSPPSLQSLIGTDSAKSQPRAQLENGSSMKQPIGADVAVVAKSRAISQQQQSIGKSSNSSSETGEKSSSSSRLALSQHLRQMLALQQQELVAHLTNLQRSTPYLVWIQAINNRGLGPQSHAISVKTLDDVPPSAPAIKVQSTTPNSITLVWSLSSNFFGTANQYSLFYRRAPQPFNQPNSGSLDTNFKTNSSPPTIESQFLSPHLYESSSFIERTVNSQQLITGGSLFNEIGTHEHAHEQKSQFAHQPLQQYQQFTYTLDQLECGSVYELYMTTRNSVGKSEPSAMITTRTLGEPPLAPTNKNSLFWKIGTHEIVLNLAAWSTGGCPLTHMTIRYKQTAAPIASAASSSATASLQANSSSSVSRPITISVPLAILAAINAQQTRSQSSGVDSASEAQTLYYLKNLLPSTSYDLEIVAHNIAGHTASQYEFVTSGLNGTKSGYSRRDNMFRLDQRGAAIDQVYDGSRNTDQQASYANQSNNGAQFVPIVLIALCLVCLIISSTFCYYRLADSWREKRGLSGDPSGSGSRGANGQHLNVSPASLGKSATWRMKNQFNGRSNPKNHHEDLGQDLPPMHYCMRDPDGTQMMGSMNQKSNSFSQSISMKDFNLIHGADPLAANSTLNIKNFRSSGQSNVERKAGTLRAGRLVSDVYAPAMRNERGQSCTETSHVRSHVCSIYEPACKQEQSNNNGPLGDYTTSQNQRLILPAEGQPQIANFAPQDSNRYDPHQTSYQSNGNQQETSWADYSGEQCIKRQHGTATTYAIPCVTQINAYDINQADYFQGTYGQGSIDDCIRQLMTEQQQRQQYALLTGKKTEPAGYFDANGNLAATIHNIPEQHLDPKLPSLSGVCGQSIIDSSSSSSGVDVGPHLDCLSTTTGASNSNASNNAYHLNRSSLDPPDFDLPPPTQGA